MELNETGKFAVETSRMIRTYFDHKMDCSGIYDIVEEANHHAFKIDFKAYDYFTIEFDYENDLCEFFIVLSKEVKLSLTKEPAVYSQIIDWDSYLKGIKDELELRIPDKFLKAKGWL
jgi:hypothetical protein